MISAIKRPKDPSGLRQNKLIHNRFQPGGPANIKERAGKPPDETVIKL
jgi:hypothetical protein